jgi:hypothetical protein
VLASVIAQIMGEFKRHPGGFVSHVPLHELSIDKFKVLVVRHHRQLFGRNSADCDVGGHASPQLVALMADYIASGVSTHAMIIDA